jgi:DNA-binding MarR family transcriptional regulator
MSRDREELLRALGDAVRANQRATEAVDAAATRLLGVNRTDAVAMDLLHQHGRLSAGRLAQEMRLTTGAITAVVDRLQQAGLVQRVPDPEDRRRVLVELTDAAQRLTWELFGPLAELASDMLARYTDEQLELLIAFEEMGRTVQERHAELLRARYMSDGPVRAPDPSR